MLKERRWRLVALLATGMVIGVAMVGTPAGAHVGGTVNHLWNHLKPKADQRYINVSETKCPAGTVKSQGMCFETTNRGPTNIYTASITCANAGRFLPNHLWLRAIRNLPGITLDAAGEWSSTEWFDDTNQWQGFAVFESGLVDPTADITNKMFRCAAFRLPRGNVTPVPSRIAPATVAPGGSVD